MASLLGHFVPKLVVGLLSGHTLYIVLEVLLDLLLPVFSVSLDQSAFLVRHHLIGEEDLVNQSVEHSSAVHSREELFVLFAVLAGEDPDEVAASIEFLDGFKNGVSELEERALPEGILQVPKVLWILIHSPVEDLGELRVHGVATYEDVVSSAWRDLNLTAKAGIQLVGLVLRALAHSHRPFRTILDLVETLLLPVESLDADHVEGVV